MKILFSVGSLSGGGAERVVSRLANEMARQGETVEIALIANNSVDYHVSGSVVVKYVNPKVHVRGMRYVFRCIEYRREVFRFDPDVIISFTAAVNLFVLDAMRGCKKKIILSERNDPYNDPKDGKLRKKRDKIYHRASGIVFQTDDAKAYFDESIQEKSTVILNPVEVSTELIGKNKKEDRIVTIGRLEPQKNQKMLIKAFTEVHQRYPEYKLEIYGEGSLRNELSKLIKDNGLEKSVYLMGYTTDVLTAIATSKMFVLTSDYEGMSNALIEAMAIGLPVISTDHPIGGARMVINNGQNGLLIPVGDAKALSDAVCEVLGNKELSERLSQNAVTITKKLNIEKITNRWMEYIHKIV